MGSFSVAAQEVGNESVLPGETVREDHNSEPEVGDEDQEEVDQEVDPCRSPLVLGDGWVDGLNRRLYTTVCGSSRWFDGFFGDDRAHDEASTTYGTVSVGMIWTEYEGLEPDFTGRVHIDLPNLEGKGKVFLGRIDQDQFLADTGDAGDIPDQLNRERERDWLLGLGYTPLNKGSRRINLSVGVKLDWPPNPYAKIQYRWYREMRGDRLFRFRQTGFWTNEEGFGTTTNLDFEQRPSSKVLMRWSNGGTLSQASEGVEWRSVFSVYQALPESRAMSYQIWAKGKTEAPVPRKEYGLWVTFRRQLHRDWLYGQVGTGVAWPQETLLEVREASFGVGLSVEIQFGDLAWDPDEG
ncbi:MAG: hypothetical protein K8R59_17110 [Thermoanaerobaculales bacterium]|nr:hypothetical protein [Thermoanaerobaculales bacterium]